MENTPWNIPIQYTQRTIADYINAPISVGLTVITVDEPELPEDSEKENPEEYKKYSVSPARLVVVSRKDSDS